MLKSILKWSLIVVILMSCLLIATRTGGHVVRAEEHKLSHGCTLSTLRGPYGYSISGLINSSSNPNDVTIPTFIPFAEEAFFEFNSETKEVRTDD
jgi:hypothetical protein